VPIEISAILRDAGPQLEGLFRIVLTGVLCALIGIEREMEGKPAGIRTYSLTGMGAAIFTVVGIYAFGPGDPASRVAAQIVTGIGFLGAGTILHWRMRVIGLTTAAGMWVSAAIGMAIGGGMYIIGIGAAIVLFIVLQFVQPEKVLGERQAKEAERKEKAPPKARG
jgi:putative Mg2+ transporter-C (MgtC) family protein